MAYVKYIVLCFTIFAFSADAAPRNRHVSPEDMNSHAKDWLVKYGYLRDSSDVTLFEHTMALMNMQAFHKLPVTGVVSEEEYTIMQRERCGCPDMIEDDEMQDKIGNSSSASLGRFRRYSVNTARTVWPSNNINYRFVDFSSDLSTTEQEQELLKAANKWSAASALSITRSSTSTSDMEISFQRRNHGDNFFFDGPAGILAHAFSPGDGLGGDIHFDADETFTINSVSGTDFTFIALHEMGHSLGLEHSNNPDAIMSMFFTYSPTDIRLHSDDIAGIQALYGPSAGDTQIYQPEVAVVETVCEHVYDAIADVGFAYFFFSEGRIVQTTHNFEPINQPLSLGFVFPGGPSRVDAAYVSDSVMVTIFQGSTYWRYNFQDFSLDPSTPSSIFDYGVSVNSVDAVFHIANDVYLFRDAFYWRYSRTTQTTEGPILIQSTWSQVTASASTPLTSVFYQQSEDRIFFVLGTTYLTYSSQGTFETSGNLNSDFTGNLCKWCGVRAGEPGTAEPILPKFFMIISGVVMANVIIP